MMEPRIRIGAHRGAMCHAPENTIAAFDKAIDFGTYRIECDIRRTGDGHLVMMHDATVDRTTDGTGELRELTLAKVRQLDLGGSVRVPTLTETLTCARDRCKLLLELKDHEIGTQVVEAVEAAGMLQDCTLISFDEDNLRVARQTNSAAKIGFFHLEPKPIDLAKVVDDFAATLLVVWPRAAEPAVINAAQEAGLQVRCGFADNMSFEESQEIFIRMADMGIDEISCGRPDWIARMIEQYDPPS
jgi:glycerophosphoryl diester phosphodiesterase